MTTMNNTAVEIVKGMIVKYQGGNYRVSNVKGGKVNLKAIFGSKIYYKGIPVGEVVEDGAAWYNRWSQSETYMCM